MDFRILIISAAFIFSQSFAIPNQSPEISLNFWITFNSTTANLCHPRLKTTDARRFEKCWERPRCLGVVFRKFGYSGHNRDRNFGHKETRKPNEYMAQLKECSTNITSPMELEGSWVQIGRQDMNKFFRCKKNDSIEYLYCAKEEQIDHCVNKSGEKGTCLLGVNDYRCWCTDGTIRTNCKDALNKSVPNICIVAVTPFNNMPVCNFATVNNTKATDPQQFKWSHILCIFFGAVGCTVCVAIIIYVIVKCVPVLLAKFTHNGAPKSNVRRRRHLSSNQVGDQSDGICLYDDR